LPTRFWPHSPQKGQGRRGGKTSKNGQNFGQNSIPPQHCAAFCQFGRINSLTIIFSDQCIHRQFHGFDEFIHCSSRWNGGKFFWTKYFLMEIIKMVWKFAKILGKMCKFQWITLLYYIVKNDFYLHKGKKKLKYFNWFEWIFSKNTQILIKQI